MDVTRIIELPSKTYVEEGDYIAIDNQQDGTQKVQFTNLFDNSLSQSNKIAPANVVGQRFTNISASVAQDIADVEADVNALRGAVGSPLKASTVAQMTDTNKIYVYTGSESGYTAGNWYYYNGTTWVSGGVYNSTALETDKTLTVSDMAADAKVVGDDITDLKSDLGAVTFGSRTLTPTLGDYNGSAIVSSTTRAYVCCELENISDISIANGFDFIPEVNNSGIGSNFSLLRAGWSSEPFNLSTRTEKYLLVMVRKSNNSTISASELNNILTFTLGSSVAELSFKEIERYNANFDISHLGIDSKGIYLKDATGNSDHNNIAWLKAEEDKSVALFESVCNMPSTLNQAYARFFISGVDKKTFYYLPITFTSSGETIDVYRWYNNTLSAKITALTGTVIVSDFTSVNIKLLYANGGLFIYINNTLACYTDVVQVGENAQIGVAWNNESAKVHHKIQFKELPPKYVHISIDDVRSCLKDITDNSSTYTSIFENSFFAKLKEWHLAYGATFTLNVFNYFDDAGQVELLSNVPTKYKDEFIDVSGWIRFAVHSPLSTDKYADFTDADVVSTYTSMINDIARFAGAQSVDGITRFGYFSINQSAVEALKTANVGFMGCLTSDDNRASDCGLNATERSIVQTYGEYYDFANNVVYIKSLPRLDDFTKAQNLETFKARYAHLKWSRYLEVFFHEGSAAASYDDMDELLPIIRSLGLRFDYGINNILI